MAAEGGITSVGQPLEAITPLGKRAPFEGAEKESAPLTPEKLDIVDKETMDVKLRAFDSDADGKESCISPPGASGPGTLSVRASDVIPAGRAQPCILQFCVIHTCLSFSQLLIR
jgi:hypothetical protein